MRAWQLIDSANTLGLSEMPQPMLAPGEILVRVRAAGVTPTELHWYPTTHDTSGGKRMRPVPGHEFSGTVAAVGPGVTGFEPGQDVFGFNDWFANGAMADYCITRPDYITTKPRTLHHTEAASVPIGALTAWQGLFDRAKLQSGERILIHGGSGAVGAFAVQFAHRHGARVITTASLRNRDFVRRLGADQFIDYRKEPFEELVKDVDVVFDTVGADTLHRSWSVLKPQGRLVTIAADSKSEQDGRAKSAFFIVEPNAMQLAHIADLIDAGAIQPVVDAVVPFDEVADAYNGWIPARAGRGKLVVAV